MANELEKLVHELDSKLVEILVNIETLEHVQRELTNIRQKVDSVGGDDDILMTINGLLIRILDDLLFYTVADLNNNYKAASIIMESLSAQTNKD